MNRVKRLAQLLVAHYIIAVMKSDDDKTKLDEILDAGSAASNNLGIPFWTGVVSSIVIWKKKDLENLETLKEITSLENVDKFYLDEELLGEKPSHGVSSLNDLVKLMIIELNTSCQGLYIGKLGELVYRLLQSTTEEKKEEMIQKINEIDTNSKSKIERFWKLNQLLPKKDQMSFFVLSPVLGLVFDVTTFRLMVLVKL